MAGKVFFSVTMSLDGFIAPEERMDDPDVQRWMAQWMELQQWIFPQRFFRENLKLGEGGEEGRDNDIVRETFERIGASVMGKRMFDLGEQAWPEEAPFHTPVFVVTHEKRDPWERPGGTTFHFVNDGIEFLARCGWSRAGRGEGVRERRAAALVLDAAHQGGQGEAAGVTGGGVGEVLVGHAEAAAEQRRGDRVGGAERRVVPGGRPCLGLGWLSDRAQDGLGDAQLDRCDVGGASPWARSRRAASTPAWVKWLHGYGLKTTRGSSQSVPRPRTTASGWASGPDHYGPGSHVRGVSAEALCAYFHKPLPRKRTHMQRTVSLNP